MKQQSSAAPRIRTRALSLAVAAALAGLSVPASAAFFQIAENNASGIGNAYAGGAAVAEDASTVWYNPAGMTRLSGSQFVAAGHIIDPSTKFTKTSATVNSFPTMSSPGANITGGEGGDAGESALVPNLYYIRQLDDRFWVGVGINVPFGLATDYDDDWVGRYHADRSEVMTINVNPAVAYRASDTLSLGGGISIQYIDAELSQAIDFGTICDVNPGCPVPLTQQSADGKSTVAADDTSFGFNFGLLWQASPETRVGFAYRSSIKHELEGSLSVTTPNAFAAAIASAAGLFNGGASADVELPATVSLSGYHQLSPQWALMADVTQTRWSDLPELRVKFDTGAADSVVTLGLENVYRYSLGATYAPGGNWRYRFGLALDQSPTPSAELRTPRLPDADRTWFALGASYQPNPTTTVDVGVVHIKVDDAPINKSTGSSTSGENFFRGNLVGTYEADVNIVSVQGSWKF